MERICSIGKSLNIILNNNNNNKRTKQNWLGSLLNQNDQIRFYLFFKLLCWKPRRFSSNGTSSPRSHLCAKEAGPCLMLTDLCLTWCFFLVFLYDLDCLVNKSSVDLVCLLVYGFIFSALFENLGRI